MLPKATLKSKQGGVGSIGRMLERAASWFAFLGGFCVSFITFMFQIPFTTTEEKYSYSQTYGFIFWRVESDAGAIVIHDKILLSCDFDSDLNIGHLLCIWFSFHNHICDQLIISNRIIYLSKCQVCLVQLSFILYSKKYFFYIFCSAL